MGGEAEPELFGAAARSWQQFRPGHCGLHAYWAWVALARLGDHDSLHRRWSEGRQGQYLTGGPSPTWMVAAISFVGRLPTVLGGAGLIPTTHSGAWLRTPHLWAAVLILRGLRGFVDTRFASTAGGPFAD